MHLFQQRADAEKGHFYKQVDSVLHRRLLMLRPSQLPSGWSLQALGHVSCIIIWPILP